MVKDPVTSANDFNHNVDMIYKWANNGKWNLILTPLSRQPPLGRTLSSLMEKVERI